MTIAALLQGIAPATRIYFKVRARQFFSRIWIVGIVTNILSILMVDSYIDESAREGLSQNQIQSDLHYGWGLIWFMLLTFQFVMKLHRSPMQIGPVSRQIFCNLPLDERNLTYCALIDSFMEGRSVLMFLSFFFGAFLFYFVSPATLLFFVFPFALCAELAMNATAGFLHTQDFRIRAVLIRIGLLFLGITFCHYAWEIRWLGPIISKGAMNPVGVWLWSVLLGEKPWILVPWNLAAYGLAFLSLRYMQHGLPASGLGWDEVPQKKIRVFPLDGPDEDNAISRLAQRTSRLELFATIFFIFFWGELVLVGSEVKDRSFSPYTALALISTFLLFHGLAVASWPKFCLKRTLPIPTWKVLFDSIKVPALFLSATFIQKALTVLALGTINGLPPSLVLASSAKILLWAAPLAIYSTCLCMCAGLICFWLAQRGFSQWPLLSLAAITGIEVPFWFIQYWGISLLWKSPVVGALVLVIVSGLLLQASIWLLDRLDLRR